MAETFSEAAWAGISAPRVRLAARPKSAIEPVDGENRGGGAAGHTRRRQRRLAADHSAVVGPHPRRDPDVDGRVVCGARLVDCGRGGVRAVARGSEPGVVAQRQRLGFASVRWRRPGPRRRREPS